MKIVVYTGFVFLLLCSLASAQQKLPFWDEVQGLKKNDSLSFPSAQQILLIGSSSFTLWKDVQDYFPKMKLLNRSFGGSTLLDLIAYRYDVIYPYQPKQIVMYCGENDFAVSDTVREETVVQRFQQLFQLIRARYPSVSFVYVSMKPSPLRKHLMTKFERANDSIQAYLRQFKKTDFVDVYHAMLRQDGSPMTDIFLEDQLHMNAKGYAIWQKLLQPVLKK